MKKVLKWGGLFLGLGIGAMLAVIVIGGQQAKHDLISRMVPPGTIAAIHGGKWHYQLLGTGPVTIIMEAGQNETSLTWSKIAPALAPHARVFIYDRAGLGWSAPVPPPRTADHILNELSQLLRQAEVKPPYIFWLGIPWAVYT